MASSLGVEIEKGLASSINELVKSLNKLEQVSRANVASQKRLTELLDPKPFNEFITSLSRLGKEGRSSFDIIVSGIKAIVKAIAKLDSASKTTLQALAKIFVTLSNGLGGVTDNEGVKGFFDFVEELVKQIKKIPKGSEEAINAFSKSLRSLSALFNSFSGKSFRNIKKISNSLKDIKNFFKLFAEVLEFQQTAFDRVRAIGRGQDTVKDPFKEFTRLAEGISKLSEVIRKMPGLLNIPAIINRQIKIILLIGSLRTILEGVNDIARKISNEGGLDAIDVVSRVIDRFGRGVFRILSALKEVPSLKNPKKLLGDFVRTRVLVFLIGQVVQGIAKVSQRVADSGRLDAFVQVARVLDVLSRGMAAIITIQKGFPTFSVSKLIRSYVRTNQLIGFLTRIISSITKSVSKTKGFSADSLNAIGKFLISIDKLFDQLAKIDLDRLDKSKLKKLSQILSALFQPFSKLKQVKVDFNKLFSSLPDLLNALPMLEKLDNFDVDPKKLRNLFKNLVSSFLEINKLDINPKKIKDFVEVMKSLKELPSAVKLPEVRGQGIKFGGDLAKSIEEGFLRANLKIALARFFLGAIKALNPISLTIAITRAVSNAVSQIRKFINNTINSVMSLGRNIKQLGDNLSQVGRNLVNNVGLNKIFSSSGFQAAIDFDKASTQVQVFGRLTDEELGKVQELANRIGIDYPLSASEAINAALGLIKAGVSDIPAIESVLPTSADLAALSDTGSIENATGIIIAAVSSFSEFSEGVVGSYENASAVADILAGAADISTASIESLGEGLSNVGAQANAFGLTLTDTAAVLAVLDNASIKGAQGGTAFRSVLNQINSEVGRAELKRLGVDLFDANGNFRDLDAVLKDVNESFTKTTVVTTTVTNLTADQNKQLNLAQRAYTEALGKIDAYNTEIAAGVITQEEANGKIAKQQAILERTSGVITNITGNITESNRITKELTRTQAENSTSAKKLFGAYGLVAGQILLSNNGFDDQRIAIEGSLSAQEKAVLLLDNLAGDLLQFSGTLETLLITAFLPLINRFFRPIVQLGRSVLEFFLALDQSILNTVVNSVLLASTFATVAGVFLVISGALLSFTGLVVSAVGALALLVLNTGALVLGFGALLASTALLIAVVSAFGVALVTVGNFVEKVFFSIENNVGGAGLAFIFFSSTVKLALTQVKTLLFELFNGLRLVFGTKSEGNVESFGAKVALVLSSLSFKVIQFSALVAKLQQNLRKFFVSLSDAKANDQVRDFLFGTLSSVKDGAQGGAQKLVSGLIGNLQTFVASNKDTLQAIGTTIIRTLIPGAFIGKILSALGLDSIADPINKVFSVIESTISKFVGLFLDIFSGKKLGDALTDNFSGDEVKSIQKFFSSLGRLVGNIIGLFKDLGKALFVGSGTNKSILSVFFDTVSLAFSLFNTLVITPLRVFLPPIVSLFVSLARVLGSVASVVVNFLSSAFNPLLTALESLFGGESNFAGSAGSVLSAFVESIVRFFVGLPVLIGGVFSSVGRSIGSEFLVKFGEQLQVGNFLGALGVIGQGFADIISAAIRLVPNALVFLGETFSIPILTKLGEDLLASKDVGGVLVAIVSAFASVIGGALLLVPDALINLGSIFSIPLLTKLGEDLKASTDVFGVLNAFSSAILNLVSSAIAKVPELLINLGTTFSSPILTKLGENLQASTNVGGVISAIANAILDVLKAGLAAVPALLTNIGESFSSPVLTKLGDELQTAATAPEAVNAVAEAFRGLIENAIGLVPSLVTNLGELLNLQVLVDLGSNLQESPFLAQLERALTNIAALGVDTFNAFVTGIGKVVTEVNENPESANRLVLLAGGIGAVVIAASGSAILAGLATGLAAIGTAIQVKILPVLLPILKFVAVLTILKSVVSNLDSLVKGNVGEFLINTLAEIASTLLGFLGIELSKDNIVTRFNEAIRQLIVIAEISLRRLANSIAIGLRNIGDGISLEINKITANTAQVLGGAAGTVQADAFNVINDSFSNAVRDQTALDFNFLSEQLAKANFDPITLPVFRVNNQKILQDFTSLLLSGGFDDVSKETAGAIANSIFAADALGDALLVAAGEGKLPETLSKLFSNASKEALALVNFSDILFETQSLASAGQLDVGDALKVALELSSEGLISDEQYSVFVAGLRRDFESRGIPFDFEISPEGIILNGEKLELGENVITDDLIRQFRDGLTIDAATLLAEGNFIGEVDKLFQEAYLIAEQAGSQQPFSILADQLFSVEGLSEEQQRIVTETSDFYSTLVQETKGLLEAGEPVPVDLPVQVTPSVQESEDPALVVQSLEQGIQESIAAAGGLATPVEVTPDLTVEDAQTANEFKDALVGLEQQSVLTQAQLTNLQTQSSLVTQSLAEATLATFGFSGAVVLNTIVAGASWVGFANAFKIIGEDIVTTTTYVKDNFETFVDETVIKFGELVEAIRLVGQAVSILNEDITRASVSVTTGGGPGTPPPGRAQGGPVSRGRLYEVFDSTQPEILQDGGKFYLLPASGGMVTPLAPNPSMASERAGRGASGVNVSIAGSTVNVTIPEGLNAQQVAQLIQQRLDQSNNRQATDLRRVLRLNGLDV